MDSGNNLKRIVITGPESTGKTELAKNLAERLNAAWIPEYARQYVEKLDRPYGYEDVIKIARYQIDEANVFDSVGQSGLIIYDTWLIITKVWLDVVYGTCPEWITDFIRSSNIDLFLVCNTDLPWLADPVRENGGEKREELLLTYIHEIQSFGFKYEMIYGYGNARIENAINALSKHRLKP